MSTHRVINGTPLPTLLPRGGHGHAPLPQYDGFVKPPMQQQRGGSPQRSHPKAHHHAHRHNHGGGRVHEHRGEQNHHGDPGQGEVAGKGAISLLQEFIQCSKQFQAPQHRPILQWGFDTRMPDFTTLEFRATVAFVLDGVPHHVAGAWHLSKKIAQRDAAERALGFFVGSWGEALLVLEQGGAPAACGPSPPSAAEAAKAGLQPREVSALEDHPLAGFAGQQPREVRALEEFVGAFMGTKGQPRWQLRWDGDRCTALFEMALLGVPHKFSGAAERREELAYADTARRVLWYFRCPGYEDAFEPDPTAPAVTAREIPTPPANWASDNSEEDALHVAERKTALMRVQNRLQQAFARQLRPGQSVWEWSYQTDSNDAGWPPLCRATVHIPVAGKDFTGDWARGQRDAQIDASAQVTAFLDGRASGNNGADGCGADIEDGASRPTR